MHSSLFQDGPRLAPVVFRPRRSLGTAVGASIVLVALLLAVLLGRKLFEISPSLASLPFGLAIAVLLVAAGLFAYWTYGCFTLRYELIGDQLRIVWGLDSLLIPLIQIKGLVMGSKVMERPKVAGVAWPGYTAGEGWTSTTGPVSYLATSQASIDLVYLVTSQGAYALSPPDLGQFTHQLQAHLPDGEGEAPDITLHRWPLLELEAWKDRLFLAMALVGGVLNLGLWVHTLYTLPNLPPLMALHFDILGRADRISVREDVLRFPLAAFGILLINLALGILLHQREAVAARLVMGLGVLIQVIIWVALSQVVVY